MPRAVGEPMQAGLYYERSSKPRIEKCRCPIARRQMSDQTHNIKQKGVFPTRPVGNLPAPIECSNGNDAMNGGRPNVAHLLVSRMISQIIDEMGWERRG